MLLLLDVYFVWIKLPEGTLSVPLGHNISSQNHTIQHNFSISLWRAWLVRSRCHGRDRFRRLQRCTYS